MSIHVDIEVNKEGVLEDLRYANLSPWDAVAELLDNSVSAINQRWSDGNNGQISIEYYFDAQRPVLKVSDNGIGVSKEVLTEKMFRLRERPNDRGGLNEFGIGMKNGLATIGSQYRIESRPDGSATKFIVPFFSFDDAKGGLEIGNPAADDAAVGTSITIFLRQEWTVEQWDLLLDHLEFAYRTFLRGYNATPLSEREAITINASYTGRNDEVSERSLRAPELKLLKDHPAGNDQKCELNQPVRVWRQDVALDLALNEENGVVTHHKISGWIGILETGDTLRKIGIAIVRRGRALEVTGSYGWLPAQIVGSGNSFGVQRIVGELYWDSMPAQQTKTIPPDSDILQRLELALSGQFWASSPLRLQNKNYRRKTSCKVLGVPSKAAPISPRNENLKPIATSTAMIIFAADPFRGIEFSVIFVNDSAALPIHRAVPRYNRKTKEVLVHLRDLDLKAFKSADEIVRKTLITQWSVASLVIAGAAEVDRFQEYLEACEVVEV